MKRNYETPRHGFLANATNNNSNFIPEPQRFFNERPLDSYMSDDEIEVDYVDVYSGSTENIEQAQRLLTHLLEEGAVFDIYEGPYHAHAGYISDVKTLHKTFESRFGEYDETSRLALNLSKSKNSFVVVDIDNKIVWDRLEVMALRYNFQCIVNTSPRGGHLIFKNDQNSRRRYVKTCAKLGIEMDLLSSGSISLYGLGYKFKSMLEPNMIGDSQLIGDYLVRIVNDMTVLPECLNRVTRKEPIIKDKLIPVGSRNETIFRWCIQRQIDDFFAFYLGKWFCEEPLPSNEVIILSTCKERYHKQKLDFEQNMEAGRRELEGLEERLEKGERYLNWEASDDPEVFEPEVLSSETVKLKNNKKDPTDDSGESRSYKLELFKHDVRTVAYGLYGKICFCQKNKVWYVQKNQCWIGADTTDVGNEVMMWICNNLNKLRQNFTPSLMSQQGNLMKTFLQRLLPVKDEWLRDDGGINFANGYLLLHKDSQTVENTSSNIVTHTKYTEGTLGRLYKHHFDRFINSCYNMDYVHNLFPDKILRNRISESCDNNDEKIMNLRSLFYRALIPQSHLQTGYVIFGGPASGKSTFSGALSRILGVSALSVSASQMDSGFSRTELKNKNLLVFSEEDAISTRYHGYFKALMGRDTISGEIKNSQGLTNFVHEGVIVITSNASPSEVIADNVPLADRFITIEFRNKSMIADPLFKSDVYSRLPQLVNWALSLSFKKYERHYVRASLLNMQYKVAGSPILSWMNEYLSYDSTGYIPKTVLWEKYKEHCAECNIRPHSNNKFFTDLVTHCTRLFKLEIKESRETTDYGRIRVIKGLSLDKTDHVSLEDILKRQGEGLSLPRDAWGGCPAVDPEQSEKNNDKTKETILGPSTPVDDVTHEVRYVNDRVETDETDETDVSDSNYVERGQETEIEGLIEGLSAEEIKALDDDDIILGQFNL